MPLITDSDSVLWGDYSPNYEYVKEAFAVRSGLVSKDRLFSENESAYLYRCVDFAKGNCETLTYEQERQLDKLQEKLTDGYPSLEAEPPTFEQSAASQQQKGKTDNSIKAEDKMESVRLVQVKDRPFSLLWGKKCSFCANPRKQQLRNRRIYTIM